MRVVTVTAGSASPVCIKSRTRASFFPSLPPGCSEAKSSARNPLRRETAMAVRDEANETTIVPEHGGDAELLTRHFVDHIAHACRDGDGGQRIAGVHQVADEGELFPELAAGMQRGEVLRAESLTQGDCDG